MLKFLYIFEKKGIILLRSCRNKNARQGGGRILATKSRCEEVGVVTSSYIQSCNPVTLKRGAMDARVHALCVFASSSLNTREKKILNVTS